jgi:hypothetical protein
MGRFLRWELTTKNNDVLTGRTGDKPGHLLVVTVRIFLIQWEAAKRLPVIAYQVDGLLIIESKCNPITVILYLFHLNTF